MKTPKNNTHAQMDSELKSILDGLEYLQIEAHKEGISDVSLLFKDIAIQLKEGHSDNLPGLKKFSEIPEQRDERINQAINLLTKISEMEKGQIDALKKILEIIS